MTYQPWPDGGADRMEQDLLARWTSEGLFAQTLDATREGAPFVFFEGPPTANGKPGIHHVFARTIKDLICRFQTMRGRSVTRIAGWDTHGLPVEIEVEKQLKLNGKKAIEEFGVDEFNRLCRESVFKYKGDWEELSNRIGYWLDYEHAYVTYTNEYVESVWWILRRLFDRNLLYRGHRVLPYCPRCGTVLSSHELALGYEEVRDKSIYVTFPLEDGSGRELVVWTTTPWTLPSNVAAAVHPELEYVVLQPTAGPLQGRQLIVAEERARVAADFLKLALPVPAGEPGAPARAGFAPATIAATLPGSDLVGLRYTRPFDVVPMPEDKQHSIVVPGASSPPPMAPGSCTWRPPSAPTTTPPGRSTTWPWCGRSRPTAPSPAPAGRRSRDVLVTADETNEIIIRRLKADGRWLHTEQHVHTYPHCWRCSSKLIYYARDSWFVRTSAGEGADAGIQRRR